VAGVLGAGALAPSNHDTRPWKLRWRDGAVEVHGDLERTLPVANPDHRRLRLACGAAIANVRLAIRAQGRRAHLQLLPDPDDRWFLGRVTVGAPLAATPVERALAHAIPHRRTDRSALSGRALDPRVREEIRRVAQREHSWAVFVDDGRRRRALQDLAARAHAVQQSGAASRTEWERWAGTENDPALLVLASTADHPLAHLQAGQALQHVLLLATVHGLAASSVAPPLEVADARTELRSQLGGALWPQAMLRLGAHGPTNRDAVLTEEP
jgi:hypothetical protein